MLFRSNLASTYRNQGRWKEAESLEVQVMETRKRVLGEEHSLTLTKHDQPRFYLENSRSAYKRLGTDKGMCPGSAASPGSKASRYTVVLGHCGAMEERGFLCGSMICS